MIRKTEVINRATNFCSLPGSSAGKESTCNVGNLESITGLGRSPGEGNSYPLQYSGLENSTDCTDHGVRKSWTQLSDFHFFFSPTSVFLKKNLICTGLVALWHVRSSQIRDQTCVSSIGRQILYHWVTREAPISVFSTHFPVKWLTVHSENMPGDAIYWWAFAHRAKNRPL